jgi:hypothetical protein
MFIVKFGKSEPTVFATILNIKYIEENVGMEKYYKMFYFKVDLRLGDQEIA